MPDEQPRYFTLIDLFRDIVYVGFIAIGALLKPSQLWAGRSMISCVSTRR